MSKTKLFTLGAAAALFGTSPAFAGDGHQHDPSHAQQGANAEAGLHGAAAQADAPAQPKPNYGKRRRAARSWSRSRRKASSPPRSRRRRARF